MIIAPASIMNRIGRIATFTASGSFTVPPDVFCLWIDACSGGSGGGGGYNGSGGGGGGGAAGAPSCLMHPFKTIPGEVLSIVIGAGGAGGVPGSNGSPGGITSITGLVDSLVLYNVGLGNTNPGSYGIGVAGTATLGGTNGYYWYVGGIAGTSSYGAAGSILLPFANQGDRLFNSPYRGPILVGSSGGGPSSSGGSTIIGNDWGPSASNGTDGGGGHGGLSGLTLTYRSLSFQSARGGGSHGDAANATGYGNGGAGGRGNGAGGNGSGGMARLFYQSSY